MCFRAAQTRETTRFNAFYTALALHSDHYSGTTVMETEALILNIVFQENQRKMKLCIISIANGN